VAGDSFEHAMPFGLRNSGLLILFLLGSVHVAVAQENETVDAPITPIVSDVRFQGNTFFSDAELALRIRTSPNRRLLNAPGLTWWLWLYRAGESGSLGRRIGEMLMASGEAPAFLDSSVVTADVQRLRTFYLQEGFRQAQVEARIDTLGNGRRARVTFLISPGEATYIRQVRFEGLDGLVEPYRSRLLDASLLKPESIAQDQSLSFQPSDQRYSEPVLLEERQRVLALLWDAGYAAVTRDSIRAIIFPQGPYAYDVVFNVDPGPRYRFGDVHFEVTGPEPGILPRLDTLTVNPDAPEQPGGAITARIVDESKLEPGLLQRALQFRPGDWYNESELLATKRRLEATGVFTFTDIIPLAADTAAIGSFVAPRLPHRFELRTRRRHQIRLETFLLQRSGVSEHASEELGTGLGVTYQNANLFGGGEVFQIGATGSVSADVDSTAGLFNSAQAEVTTSLTYPYLVGPFGGLEGLFDLYDARTRFSFSLLTARRSDQRLILTRGLGRSRLELQHSPTDFSFVDLIDVSLSNPDTLDNFTAVFLNEVLGLRIDENGDTTYLITDPVQRAQILEDYTRPQVNSAFRYTFRSMTANPLRRDAGYSFESGFEIGSNLPYLLDRFVVTPGTVEGSLPGLPIFGGSTDTRLVYRQYVRFTADLRRYHPLAQAGVFAWKAIAGFAQPTGRSDLIPFDRRFYSGGATGVRGWELRSLGPAATNTFQGGEIKLEGAVELRNRIIRNLLAADWSLALFADAGNVWLGPRNNPHEGRFRFDTFYRQIGVGSGAGLRITWEYLILRLDLAYKAYDPARQSQGLFPDGFRSPVLHFGIGHAF
jgi:outer membrane protein insertion porin family